MTDPPTYMHNKATVQFAVTHGWGMARLEKWQRYVWIDCEWYEIHRLDSDHMSYMEDLADFAVEWLGNGRKPYRSGND